MIRCPLSLATGELHAAPLHAGRTLVIAACFALFVLLVLLLMPEPAAAGVL